MIQIDDGIFYTMTFALLFLAIWDIFSPRLAEKFAISELIHEGWNR